MRRERSGMKYSQQVIEMLHANAEYVSARARKRKREKVGTRSNVVVVADAAPGAACETLEALGIERSACAVVTVAHAEVLSAYGEGVRSVLAAVSAYAPSDIVVVGRDKGADTPVPRDTAIEGLVSAGVSRARIERTVQGDPRAKDLLRRASTSEGAVRRTVFLLRNHPLMPRSVRVWGFALEPRTGKIRAVP